MRKRTDNNNNIKRAAIEKRDCILQRRNFSDFLRSAKHHLGVCPRS